MIKKETIRYVRRTFSTLNLTNPCYDCGISLTRGTIFGERNVGGCFVYICANCMKKYEKRVMA